MKRLLIFAMLLMSLPALARDVDCDNAMTTRDMNYCAGQEAERADAKMAQYLSKARERFKSEPNVVTRLDESQLVWLEYRKNHCDAVYEIWREGTIRGVMYAGCMTQTTEARSYTLWESYLTYMDSTPPLLPDPRQLH